MTASKCTEPRRGMPREFRLYMPCVHEQYSRTTILFTFSLKSDIDQHDGRSLVSKRIRALLCSAGKGIRRGIGYGNGFVTVVFESKKKLRGDPIAPQNPKFKIRPRYDPRRTIFFTMVKTASKTVQWFVRNGLTLAISMTDKRESLMSQTVPSVQLGNNRLAVL